MSPERIGIYLPNLEIGGAERVMVGLAACFLRRGFEVDLVLASRTGRFLPQVPAGVRVVDLAAGHMSASIPGLARYLRRERPACLISGLDMANIIVILARILAAVRVRLLLTSHTFVSVMVTDPASRRADRLYPLLLRLFHPWARSLVAITRGVAADLVRIAGIPAGKIQVIHNPLPDDIVEKSRLPLDHPWFQDGGVPLLLSVGRLTTAKDYPTLLRAFALLRQSRPARLVILGDGDLCASLEELAAELGVKQDVNLLGFDLNPFRYMARCQVFVLSSVFEGFGNVIVEALACGAQVVATDCPSGPREILEGGKYGRLTPVGDPTALALAIQAALDEPLPPELLRERAKDFGIDAAADAYLRAMGLA